MEENLNTYEVTHKASKELWIFQFRKSDGNFQNFFNDPKGTQINELLEKGSFPKNETIMEKWKNYPLVLKVELKTHNYEFEEFYNRYGLKISPKESRKLYEKLDTPTRMKCFAQLPKYDAHLQKTGQSKAHLTTWLNKERYNDEY